MLDYVFILIILGLTYPGEWKYLLEEVFLNNFDSVLFGKESMDPSTTLEDEDTPTMKTIKGATMGLAAGTIWGTVVATWYDVPRVERNVALPGLIRTLKMCGNYGLTFAAIGGLYIGVEQLVQKYRMKEDFVNGAVGAFVAGASVYGLRGEFGPWIPFFMYGIYVGFKSLTTYFQ